MNIKILSLLCVRMKGRTDQLYIEIDTPNPFQYNQAIDPNAILKMELPIGSAEDYCEKNFPNLELNIRNGG